MSNTIKRIVKQIHSGDSVILQTAYAGDTKPRDTHVGLSWIMAPKMYRKVQGTEHPEELGAFEAREFLRKRIIGKEVLFQPINTITLPSGTRELGLIYLESDKNGPSLNEQLIEEGLVEVIRKKIDDPMYKKFLELEERAKDAKKGRWAEGKPTFKRRKVLNEITQERAESFKGKTFKDSVIVENINFQSYDQMRIAILVNEEEAEWQMITLKLSGIKAKPEPKNDLDDYARYFIEYRILQRDVAVRIEHLQRLGDNPILFGSVYGGKEKSNNIAIALLKFGLATIIDSTLKLTDKPEEYRRALLEGKRKRLGIWKNYKEDADKAENGVKGKETYEGKVVEIINGDALNILSLKDNQVRKVFLASIKPPPRRAETSDQKIRPLYDTPFMFEAREFLRKRLIGKKVQVTVDYIQPKTDQYPEKIGATITHNGANIGEALVLKGYATVIKYKANEERKASNYDQLLDAEIKAVKDKKGLHGKESSTKQVVELANDIKKAKSFASFLIRGSARKEALVEHVYSSSRIKVFIPKENCLLNFILQGINAPKANEGKYGAEGLEFVKSLIHQRDVELTIESMDKVGNFIGLCYYNAGAGAHKNLSLILVMEGLAKIRDSRDPEMIKAEEEAKNKRKRIWEDWQPELEEEDLDDEDDDEEEAEEEEEVVADEDGNVFNGDSSAAEKKTKKVDKIKDDLDKRKKVVISEVSPDMSSFYVQYSDKSKEFEELMEELRNELDSNPPLPGVLTPKKGDTVVAKFSQDNEWYRGKVEKVHPSSKEAEIMFVDYGNREIVANKNIAALPSSKFSLSSFPAAAHLVSPAFLYLPQNDAEDIKEARDAFVRFTGKELLLKVEYKDTVNGVLHDFVTLVDIDTKEDIGMNLVKEGYFMVRAKGLERKKDKRLVKVIADYQKAQDHAKSKRLNLWIYGDSTEDDAKEFGYVKA